MRRGSAEAKDSNRWPLATTMLSEAEKDSAPIEQNVGSILQDPAPNSVAQLHRIYTSDEGRRSRESANVLINGAQGRI